MFNGVLPNWLQKRKRQPPQTEILQPKKLLGINVLAFADVHGNHVDTPDCEPDVVLFLGDIPYFVVQDLDKRYRCPKLGVLGNHDGTDYLEGTSVVNLHAKTVNIGGVTFAGFGGSPRYSGKPHGQYTEDEAGRFVDRLDYVDVFIAHSNPRRADRPDLLKHPPHAGFTCFTDYIKRVQPQYFFHGHIHEQEAYQLGATTLHSVYGTQEFFV